MKPADVTETLKPCPFCGNDGSGPIEDALHISFHEAEWRYGDAWSVQCDKCTATMGYSKTKDEAIDAWNTRAAPVVKQSLTGDVTEADRVAVTVIDLAAHDIHRREQIMANHRIAAFEAGRVAGLEEAAGWHDSQRAKAEAHHIAYCNKTGVFANVSPYTPAIGRHREDADAIRALKEKNDG